MSEFRNMALCDEHDGCAVVHYSYRPCPVCATEQETSAFEEKFNEAEEDNDRLQAELETALETIEELEKVVEELQKGGS